jgi:hypothetical protein
MAAIQPEGENLRQALKWISGERQEDDSRILSELIAKSSRRFNLSPREEEFLNSFYREKHPGGLTSEK